MLPAFRGQLSSLSAVTRRFRTGKVARGRDEIERSEDFRRLSKSSEWRAKWRFLCRQDLIEQLTDRSLRFEDGVAMVHRSG
jgi:hypothetical protein